MRVIPTSIHGIGDYLGGLALLFAPELFGFSEVGGAAEMVPRLLGIVILLQAAMTRFELGLVKVLPMNMHLMNDYVASLFLAVSPWLFGFNDLPANAWVPHLVVGLGVFLFSLMTEKAPRHAELEDHHSSTARSYRRQRS